MTKEEINNTLDRAESDALELKEWIDQELGEIRGKKIYAILAALSGEMMFLEGEDEIRTAVEVIRRFAAQVERGLLK